MSLRQKVKRFFKANEASDSAVELLRQFILPFGKSWDPKAGVDDMVAAFFAVNDRKFFHGTAKRNFNLPGQYIHSNIHLMQKKGPRAVTQGQYMLIVVDAKDQQTKVQIELAGQEREYRLTRAETEFLKDYVEVTPCDKF